MWRWLLIMWHLVQTMMICTELNWHRLLSELHFVHLDMYWTSFLVVASSNCYLQRQRSHADYVIITTTWHLCHDALCAKFSRCKKKKQTVGDLLTLEHSSHSWGLIYNCNIYAWRAHTVHLIPAHWGQVQWNKTWRFCCLLPPQIIEVIYFLSRLKCSVAFPLLQNSFCTCGALRNVSLNENQHSYRKGRSLIFKRSMP